MSTYTDLKNRVKENITVGYDANDRTTLQKVKFHNEENEYWGTFTGKVDVADITVQRGSLNDVSIYNSYIKNATLVNEDGIKINLSELGEGLDEISNVTIPELRKDIAYVSAEISTMHDVPGEVKRLEDKLNEVSGAVSSEICARISADRAVSSYISAEFDEKLSAESRARASGDIELDTAIKAERDARVQAISGLSGAFESCVEENKHYHIQPVNSDVRMPFKAREFAVNVINNYDLPDAFVKDAQTGDMVARVERYVASSRNCEFVPFADAPDKYMSILGPNAFIFGDGQTQRDCKDPAYRLTYYRNGETGAVTDQHFGLSPVDVGVRHVYYNNIACGIVTQANEETVVSGYVRITADSQSPLSVFADGLDHYFKVNVPVEFNGGNDRLIFEEATKAFRCELGIKTYAYEGLSSRTAGTEWGKVLRDSIEGSTASPSAFAVTFQPIESQIFKDESFRLSEENGFKADVWRDPNSTNLDVVKYANGVVSYYNEKIRYGYSVEISTAVDVRVGEIIIGEYNRVLSDDFGSVDIVLSAAFPGSPLWTSPITLYKNPEGGYSRETTVLGREISINFFSKSRVKIVIKSGEITDTMYGNITGLPYARIDHSLPPYRESQRLFFPLACENVVKIPSDVKTAYVSGRDSGARLTCFFDCVTQYNYRNNTYNVNDIVIEIPNKPEGSSISREFLFVVKAHKAGTKANIRFVGADGRDIKWYSDKKPVFEILTETFITFKLQEVRDQRFLVVDWNFSRQEQEIDDLYAKLAAETSARISADLEEISARISSDLSIISKVDGISAGIWQKVARHDEQISAISSDVSALMLRDRKDISLMGELTANGIKTLSSFLLNQAVFGPRPTEASVRQNWMYRMSGMSELPMVDNAGVSGYIGDNDYVLFKPEKKLVKDILFSDMNFIRDAQAETSAVAARICAWTNGNFMHLSGGNSVSGSNDFVGQLNADGFAAQSAVVSTAVIADETVSKSHIVELSSDALSVSNAYAGSINADNAAAISAEISNAYALSLSAAAMTACSAFVSSLTADVASVKKLSVSDAVSAPGAEITAKKLAVATAVISALAVPDTLSASSVSAQDMLVLRKADIAAAAAEEISAKTANVENLVATGLSAQSSGVFFTDLSVSAGSELTRLSLSASTNAEGVAVNKKAVDELSVRYANTFLSSEHRSSVAGCEELSADNLRLFDEHSYAGEDHHREYRMVLSAGTIVLKKVNRLFI